LVVTRAAVAVARIVNRFRLRNVSTAPSSLGFCSGWWRGRCLHREDRRGRGGEGVVVLIVVEELLGAVIIVVAVE